MLNEQARADRRADLDSMAVALLELWQSPSVSGALMGAIVGRAFDGLELGEVAYLCDRLAELSGPMN